MFYFMLLAQTFGDTDNVEQERNRGRTKSMDGSLSRNSNHGRPRPWFGLTNDFFIFKKKAQIYYAYNGGALHVPV